MTTDPKLPPLPKGTEAGEYMMDAILFDHSDMISYARAAAIRADARDAEIERLRAELEIAKGQAEFYRTERNKCQRHAERLAEELRICR